MQFAFYPKHAETKVTATKSRAAEQTPGRSARPRGIPTGWHNTWDNDETSSRA